MLYLETEAQADLLAKFIPQWRETSRIPTQVVSPRSHILNRQDTAAWRNRYGLRVRKGCYFLSHIYLYKSGGRGGQWIHTHKSICMSFWRANCPVLGILKHLVLGHILMKKNCLVYVQALVYATVDSGGRTPVTCGWGSHVAPSQMRFNSKQEMRTENVKWIAVCLLIEIRSSAQICLWLSSSSCLACVKP